MISRVCIVARECDGYAGAGGLKDVVRGLADALTARGVSVVIIIPRYGFMSPGEPLFDLTIRADGRDRSISVTGMERDGLSLRFIDAPEFSTKDDIYTYTDEDAPEPALVGKGHLDAPMMNVILQAGAVALLMKEGPAPDIIHGHDGHCGLLSLYMRREETHAAFFADTACLVTIHNAATAYQQSIISVEEASRLSGLDKRFLALGLVDGSVNPLLIAGIFGNINTVSPDYSKELTNGADPYSGSLGYEFRRRHIPVPGIYNGIAADDWLRRSGGAAEKSSIRRRLARSLGRGRFEGVNIFGNRPNPNRPWLVFHGRLTQQKGLDEILNLPEGLLGRSGGTLIIYGQGDPAIEHQLKSRTADEDTWTFLRGYDEELTAVLLAASSFVLVPSKWEPCGQIDMIGQLLGAIPIVREVGGLKKIRNGKDGFSYRPNDASGLQKSIQKALYWELNRHRKVSRMRQHAEHMIYGRRTWWTVLVRGYLPLYAKARKNRCRKR
ncbi:MAG: glycogen/starch synthase [Spirochaetaceae bacterium]|nr:glycogen/starch synthase [Spirochaetaceae bacterium]